MEITTQFISSPHKTKLAPEPLYRKGNTVVVGRMRSGVGLALSG